MFVVCNALLLLLLQSARGYGKSRGVIGLWKLATFSEDSYFVVFLLDCCRLVWI